jgi:hypothetical protein
MVNELLNDIELKKLNSKDYIRKVYSTYLVRHKVHTCILDMSTAKLICDSGGRDNHNIMVYGKSISIQCTRDTLHKNQNICLIGPKITLAKLFVNAGIINSNKKHKISFRVDSIRRYDLVSVIDVDGDVEVVIEKE